MTDTSGDGLTPAQTGDIVDAEVVINPQALDPALTATPYTESGVPTFDHVRDKIEQRVTRALGSEELANETSEGQAADELYRKNKEAAASKLAEIRKSMGQ
ncbi:hypothetical protein GOEFS_073_00240 [Gordonia effusa NBRC 100432]|uniref:Uncharacterized protein n=1 Tax=Gordonia effusa NBRC 100432 TaxID=1077974 RepID=H0R1Q3_9ACTN|nr:hypothetical protein [Gordonia effusa]GAB19004.1 hypothetical protein GOEFS_073_00240 [Gordonia effusa NBRC 100432]